MDALKTSRAADRGYSLIEVLIALVVLGFIAVGIMGMLSQGVRLNATSRDYTALTNLAKSRLEELISLPFRSAALAPNVTHTIATPDDWYRVTYTVEEYNLTAAVADPTTAMAGAGAVGTGNIKRITLTVTAVNDVGVGERNVTVEAIKHVR